MTALSCMLIWAMGMLKLLLKVRKLARPPRVPNATHSAQGQDTAQNGAEDVADVAQLGGDRHEHAGEGVGVLGALEEGARCAG